MKETMKVIQEIVLEKIRIRLEQKVSRYTLTKMSFTKELSDMLTDYVVFKFETEILGQKQEKEYIVFVEIPLNWWEHLIQDKFPNWYKKKFPIKTKKVKRTIKFNHYALMPDLNIKLDESKVIMYSQSLNIDVYEKS